MKIKTLKVKLIIKNIARKCTILLLSFIILYNLIYNTISIFDKNFNFSFFGNQFWKVKDNLMSPLINKGDIIVTTNNKKEEIKTGDIIIFYQDSNNIIIQRVVKININNYVTKGDNNYYNNIKEIKNKDIKGIVCKVIPYLGFTLDILQSKILTIILFITVILLYRFNKITKINSIKRRKKKIYTNPIK